MHEILLFGVVIGAIFSIFASAILIHLGTLIDRFPLEDEEERERTLWSPREFTRFAVIVYWPLYVTGVAMLLPGTRVMTVAGIALIFGLLLFMVTALVFSVATYNLMVSRRNGWGTKRPLGLFSGTHFFFRTLPQKSPGKKYPGRTAIKEKDAREKSPGPDETGEGRFPR